MADHRADIYSLGCTFYFLLTGETPYHGDSVMEKLFAHREQAIPSLVDAVPETPQVLEAVFRRMLAKKAEYRYQSMDDVIRDLEQVATRLSPPMRHAQRPAVPVSPSVASVQSQSPSRASRSASPSVKRSAAPSVAPTNPPSSSRIRERDARKALGQSMNKRGSGEEKPHRKVSYLPVLITLVICIILVLIKLFVVGD